MMVQCPVKPVVEELHRPHMQQSHEQCSICPPNWKVGRCAYQFLSLSTCSNSMLLSTIRFLLRAFWKRAKLIQTWLWSILNSKDGSMMRYVRSSSFLSLLTNKYRLCKFQGANTRKVEELDKDVTKPLAAHLIYLETDELTGLRQRGNPNSLMRESSKVIDVKDQIKAPHSEVHIRSLQRQEERYVCGLFVSLY
ncbi:hypothetical protein C4D60_Mb11t15150 [Musa balbisiana]|uniref:Uncharacterized protein n=1 Tax=Musa balbisiana TaxID=52838 RepID=A0A4S8J4F4_MUSBA|nr:hypothetical protein C4D60_Mb11t15150 [Musa balbisiana]